jgi:hypothetical protein
MAASIAARFAHPTAIVFVGTINAVALLRTQLRWIKPNTTADVSPSWTSLRSRGLDDRPFARALFVYVNLASLQRPEVAAFTQFYIDNAGPLSSNAGYIAFDDSFYSRVRERLAKREPSRALRTATPLRQ